MKRYIFISLLFICIRAFGQNSVTIPVTDCPDQTFSANTSGWSLFYGNNLYNQNTFLSSMPIPPVHYQQGSNTINSISEGANLGNRVSIADGTELYNNTAILQGGGSINLIKYLRLGGNLGVGGGSEQMIKKYNLTLDRPTIHFFYATVFKNVQENEYNSDTRPFFRYEIKVQYNDGTYASLPPDMSGFVSLLDQQMGMVGGNRVYSSVIIQDFSEYVDFCRDPVVTISAMVSDGKVLTSPPSGYDNHNSVYAYVSAQCMDKTWSAIETVDKLCTNTVYNLVPPGFSNQTGSEIISTEWKIQNQETGATVVLPGETSIYSFSTPDHYSIIYVMHFANGCEKYFSVIYEVFQCPPPSECVDCTSFDLELGKKYVVTGWVNAMKDAGEGNYQTLHEFNYDKAKISVTFLDVSGAVIDSPQVFDTSGEIIDGWQRIYGEILIPSNIDDLQLDLVNNYGSDISVFFDDIRVHPLDGNMKSFVYDQKTQKLMAELDENNYATFYEYDKEGGLVRVKKETEKGVFTIQETRSSTIKIQN